MQCKAGSAQRRLSSQNAHASTRAEEQTWHSQWSWWKPAPATDELRVSVVLMQYGHPEVTDLHIWPGSKCVAGQLPLTQEDILRFHTAQQVMMPSQSAVPPHTVK